MTGSGSGLRETIGIPAGIALGLLLGFAPLPWRPLQAAPAAAEPSHGAPPPNGRSLAPLDTESIRTRYGQEALFRLRLGVEAVPAAGARPPTGVPCGAMAWGTSPEHGRFEADLAAGRYFQAGQALGAWQNRTGPCPP